MSRNRNMFQQFNNALEQSFEEGRDKHSNKNNGDRNESPNINSYSALHNLRDFARNFSGHMKENFPDIKRLDQVNEGHLQSFLNTKNQDGCSQNTLDGYKSNFNKLENIVNNIYKSCEWDFKDKVAAPTSQRQYDNTRGADHAMPSDVRDKILDYCRANPSESGNAILCQNDMGVRVAELSELKVKNVDFEDNKIKFDNTKGGKYMEREMTPDVRNILSSQVEGKGENDKVFNVKADSINVQLGRIQDRLGLQEKYSMHDMRRLLAQEKFDQYREEGYGKQQSLDLTSKWLNHGEKRNKMLEQSYIKVH